MIVMMKNISHTSPELETWPSTPYLATLLNEIIIRALDAAAEK
jgi:hypothetical protein